MNPNPKGEQVESEEGATDPNVALKVQSTGFSAWKIVCRKRHMIVAFGDTCIMHRYEDRYSTRLYVGHLSSRTRSRDLEDLFSRYRRKTTSGKCLRVTSSNVATSGSSSLSTSGKASLILYSPVK